MLTTRYHEHDVEDDVAECEETFEEKCEDVTQGYTTEQVVECSPLFNKVRNFQGIFFNFRNAQNGQ